MGALIAAILIVFQFLWFSSLSCFPYPVYLVFQFISFSSSSFPFYLGSKKKGAVCPFPSFPYNYKEKVDWDKLLLFTLEGGKKRPSF